MPRRTREHELEDESIRAFDSILPSAWVSRPIIGGDYGVDREVEIFEGGAATGDIFKVQLKGTDKKPNKGGKYSVSIAIETLTYWWRLDTPVLVVLYSTNDGAIYAKWAQSYDLYYSRSENPKTVTFSFSSRERYTAISFPETIPRELRLIRALRERTSNLPLPVTLVIPAELYGREREELSARLHVAIRQTPHVLKTAESQDDALTLTLQRDRIKASMSGNISSATLHVEKGAYVQPEDSLKIPGDAMLTVASFLLRSGLVKPAADLAVTHAASSRLYSSPHMVDAFLQSFTSVGLFDEAWSLIKPIYDLPDNALSDIANVHLSQIILNDGNMRREGRREIADNLKRRAIEAQAANLVSAGNLMYNAGKVLEGIDERALAIEAFQQALEMDPRYLQRGYYHEELASLQFLLGSFADAVSSYERAAGAEGSSPKVQFLLSDALMKAGRYAEAAAVSIDVRSLPPEFRAGARLHQRVCSIVMAVVAVDVQQRQAMAPDEFDSLSAELPREELVALLQAHDALDPRIWYRLAFHSNTIEEGFDCMLTAAWFQEDSATAWVLAIMLGIQGGQSAEILDDACRAAFRFAEPAVLSALDQVVELIPLDHTLLRRLIYRHAELPPSDFSRVMRLHDPTNGEYEVLDMAGGEGRLNLDMLRFLATLPPEQFGSLTDNTGEV